MQVNGESSLTPIHWVPIMFHHELANLFLHYAFDKWMERHQSYIPFERYADDIICHCDISTQEFPVLPLFGGSDFSRTSQLNHFIRDEIQNFGNID
jgi:hypothetical protein